MQNKKLILFVHGLGGGDETWGKFQELIKKDDLFNAYDMEYFIYLSPWFRIKSTLSFLSAPITYFIPNPWKWVTKILPFIIPQKKISKIQDISEILNTTINNKYKNYSEIYLIAHSMGGLIARKYLIEKIKEIKNIKGNTPFKIKKLMLFDVPNNGADLAKLSMLYKHEQLEQIDRDKDFLTLLNTESRYIDIHKYTKVKYIIADGDNIVDKGSALGFWSNRSFETLPHTHTGIVKPEGYDDLNYIVFSNFILGNTKRISISTDSSIKEPSKESKDSSFVKEVFYNLTNVNQLVVLYSQDFTNITNLQTWIQEKVQYSFGEGYCHIDISQIEDEALYFQVIAVSCGLTSEINSAFEWRLAMQEKLKEKKRILLFIPNIDKGKTSLNKKLAETIQILTGEHNHFYTLFIGRKKLAELVYGDGPLSHLKEAEELYFPTSDVKLKKETIVQQLNQIGNSCEAICSDINTDWSTWSSNETLRILFWKSLLINHEGMFTWRDKMIEQLAKKYCKCLKKDKI